MKINWFKIRASSISNYICYILITGSPIKYVNLIILLSQGFWCKDCNKLYQSCECNKCIYCKYDSCICYLKIEYLGLYSSYTLSNRNKIRKKAFELLLHLIGKNNSKLIDKELREWYNQEVRDFKIKEINIIDKYRNGIKKLYEN